MYKNVNLEFLLPIYLHYIICNKEIFPYNFHFYIKKSLSHIICVCVYNKNTMLNIKKIEFMSLSKTLFLPNKFIL